MKSSAVTPPDKHEVTTPTSRNIARSHTIGLAARHHPGRPTRDERPLLAITS
ncbi:hypothetical protein Shyhy01_21160 [Streptomyces hygroscopicus subsp. hygroscopicus]|nr:hypothetical protein Shyhy01_21160 [Streptomyces hygroscopicus subsp. hygroscopicus]